MSLSDNAARPSAPTIYPVYRGFYILPTDSLPSNAIAVDFFCARCSDNLTYDQWQYLGRGDTASGYYWTQTGLDENTYYAYYIQYIYKDGSKGPVGQVANPGKAQLIVTSSLNIDQLASRAYSTGLVTAGTFRGVVFETSAVNPKVRMDPSGLFANDSSGSQQFYLNANTGAATFAGAITGGTINIGGNFTVDSSGNVAITQGTLQQTLFNQRAGVLYHTLDKASGSHIWMKSNTPRVGVSGIVPTNLGGTSETGPARIIVGTGNSGANNWLFENVLLDESGFSSYVQTSPGAGTSQRMGYPTFVVASGNAGFGPGTGNPFASTGSSVQIDPANRWSGNTYTASNTGYYIWTHSQLWPASNQSQGQIGVLNTTQGLAWGTEHNSPPAIGYGSAISAGIMQCNAGDVIAPQLNINFAANLTAIGTAGWWGCLFGIMQIY